MSLTEVLALYKETEVHGSFRRLSLNSGGFRYRSIQVVMFLCFFMGMALTKCGLTLVVSKAC